MHGIHSSTWNAGFGGRLFARRDVFWITEEQARDDDLLNDVIKLIESNLWNLDQTERHGKVISYSVSEQELRRIATKVGEMTHCKFNLKGCNLIGSLLGTAKRLVKFPKNIRL